jgi:thiamine biosynthesis protein ThiS
MSKITITVNGIETFIDKDLSLNDLILQYQLDIKKIAIEVDLNIIHPNDFSKTILTNGSNIEIVHFIGGG